MTPDHSNTLRLIGPQVTELTEEQAGPRAGVGGFIRPKGNIGTRGKLVLVFMVCVPLLMMMSRVVAYPDIGVPWFPGVEGLRFIGELLNQYASLLWVPPQHLSVAVYLLMLPTGAIFIVLARLTFGLRVLGLRSILISIGFQEIGVIPSLTVMFAVIAVIVSIRPAMVSIRLPMYARITLVLCVCSICMIGALMIGPVVQSQVVWSVAFFPVIIAAMIAEAVAKAIASDNLVTAAWRVFWTVIVAGILALIGQTGTVANTMLMFPEIMLLQLVGIIVIAEYFDLRLFEETPAKIARAIENRDLSKWSDPPVQKIAVVRDRRNPAVIGRMDDDAHRPRKRRSVQPVVDALRAHGAVVKVFDGDISLPRELERFIPENRTKDSPGGIVFNLAQGVQGKGMSAQVPAMLEMAGVPYSGPDPHMHGQLADRWLLLSRLARAGVDVPRFCRLEEMERNDIQFPIKVWASDDPSFPVEQVRSERSLRRFLKKIGATMRSRLIAEEIPDGREIRVGVLGNGKTSCLPPVEKIPRQSRRICPAQLEEKLARKIYESALAAFEASGCRDYGRVDFRITPDDKVVVIAVQFHDILRKNGSMAQAARAAGLDFGELINCIARIVRARY